MGIIYAKNDLPSHGEQSHKVEFRTKVSGSDPHTDDLKPGATGAMSDNSIKTGKDYTVKARIKISMHSDPHIQLDKVKTDDTVVIKYTNNQYILEKQA